MGNSVSIRGASTALLSDGEKTVVNLFYLRYIFFSALASVRRGSLIGKAVVLKTTARKRLQVRVLSSPPYLIEQHFSDFG